MDRLPLSLLLGGQQPDQVRPSLPPAPPPPPHDQLPPDEVMLKLALLLLQIPGVREMLIDAVRKAQAQGPEGLGPLPPSPSGMPEPPAPPATGASSFVAKLRELRNGG